MTTFDEAQSDYMVLRDLDATHDRRVRLLVIACSVALTLFGLGLFLVFLMDGRWINSVFESPIWLIGITGVLLTRQGKMRCAVLLMIFSLYAIFLAITLLGDVPRPGVPRVTHLCFIPLAFGSYIGLRKEAAWVRHGFLFLCLGAVALFSSTDYIVDVGLFLPDDLHTLVNRVISIASMGVLYLMLHIYIGDVSRMEHYLHLANNRFVSLVSGTFPKVIAERLLTNQQTFAERHTNCSVLFADIVGFTTLTERLNPEALIAMLSEVFSRFDDCVERNGLTKIKTIGDAYMVAAGVPETDPDHAKKMIAFAMHMLRVVKDFPEIDLRIGIASGELVAGVIGKSRQVYDVWGDMVNLAARIESIGSSGHIQVSEATYALARDAYRFTERAGLSIKGKTGKHNVYVVDTQVPLPASSTP